MGQENIKDFTIEWVIFGLLFTCLVSFTIAFMYSNNPIGLDDGTNNLITNGLTNGQNNLLLIDDNSNGILNVTAKTNPNEGFLGSRDSVSTSFSASKESRNSFNMIKQLIGWTFSGDIGKMLIAVFGGLIGYLIFYFGFKFIRTGT